MVDLKTELNLYKEKLAELSMLSEKTVTMKEDNLKCVVGIHKDNESL